MKLEMQLFLKVNHRFWNELIVDTIVGGTTIRAHISYTRHLVQKRNRTFRTKMKPDISCNLYYTTYYYNVVSYVHIPLVP